MMHLDSETHNRLAVDSMSDEAVATSGSVTVNSLTREDADFI
jgi:hypothetical protein